MDFITRENPDVVCMQESHEHFAELLEQQEYQCTLLPRCEKIQDGKNFVDCELLATKYPFTSDNYYYSKIEGEELPFETRELFNDGKKSHFGFIHACIAIDEIKYDIATTHFTWTPDGTIPNEPQKRDMEAFLKLIATLPPHIMCGDFNIPRNHNPLYEKLTEQYKDTIPDNYKSSLDKTIHHLGDNPEKQNLFDDFMVDYVFSQEPYVVSDVRLQFGVSDHAGVVCTIEKR